MHAADSVVVRYGELSTKSRPVRGRMERTLCENIAALLADRDIPGDVDRIHGRIVVETDAAEAAADAAADAPGVVSASPARRVEPASDAIYDALADLARSRAGSFATYAVRARRGSDDLPFTSPELEREGGSRVWEAIDGDADVAVDLDDPDVTFEVDAREHVAFVFDERRGGPGGLPVGTQAPLVALVSGGIDSPVAAYEAMRRGSPVVPVYVDLGDYGGPDHRARALAACERLAALAPNHDLRPYVVPGGEAMAQLEEAMDRGRMLAIRRYFFGVAAGIADRVGAEGIVTGEALGQKSSQTAPNLRVTSAATDYPIHRPLFEWDKPTITERAKEIGTYEEATIAAGCNRLAPDHPETAGRLDQLVESEPGDLLDRAAADADAAERVDLSIG